MNFGVVTTWHRVCKSFMQHQNRLNSISLSEHGSDCFWIATERPVATRNLSDIVQVVLCVCLFRWQEMSDVCDSGDRPRSCAALFCRHCRVVCHRRRENQRFAKYLARYSKWLRGWFGSRVVSVLDSGAEGPVFKSQPRRCRVTVLGKTVHTHRASVHQAAKLVAAALFRVARVTAGLAESNSARNLSCCLFVISFFVKVCLQHMN